MPKEDWIHKADLLGGRQSNTSIVSHKTSGVDAVMKEIKNTSNPKALARFAGEIAALEAIGGQDLDVPALIEHNLIETTFDTGEPFICMELIDGLTLARLIRNHPLPETQAIALLLPLLRTVSILHANGILHRDIKPSNIIAQESEEGRKLILVDFGLAYDLQSETEVTDPTENVGNKFLMLPETHYPAGPKHDTRSDVCQFVGILFFIVTGRYPKYLSHSRYDAPHNRSGDEIGTFSSEMRKVLDKGFSFEIENRFQSVSELNNALEKLQKRDLTSGSKIGESEEHFPLANGTFFYRHLLKAYEGQSLLGIRDEFLTWIFEITEAYTLYRTTGQGLLEAFGSKGGLPEEDVKYLSKITQNLRNKIQDVDILKKNFVLSEAEGHLYSKTFNVECERNVICSLNKKDCITSKGPIFSGFRSHSGAKNIYHFSQVFARLDPNYSSMPPRIFRLDANFESPICWKCGDLI